MQAIKAARGPATELCPSVGDAWRANPITAKIIHWLDKNSPARKGNPTQRGDCTALVLPMQNSAQGPTRIRIDGSTQGDPILFLCFIHYLIIHGNSLRFGLVVYFSIYFSCITINGLHPSHTSMGMIKSVLIISQFGAGILISR